MNSDLYDEICDKWYIKSLKDYQNTALLSVGRDKRDTLVCMPTGSGNSICFEALGQYRYYNNNNNSETETESIVLVVSPLDDSCLW